MKRTFAAAAVLLTAVGLAGAAAVWMRGCRVEPAGLQPPAPAAPAAPQWSRQPPVATDREKPPEKRPGKAAKKPAYQWPPDFKLPLEIHMDVPEVPEELRGPSPPIVEK